MLVLFFHPLVFIILWLFSFLLHELCHCWEMYRQCGFPGSIHMFFGWPPGFWCVYHHKCVPSSDRLVSFSGGVYASVFFFFLCVMSSGFFCFVFLMLGWCQLVYGMLEGMGLKRFRFVWYAVFLGSCVGLWLGWFVL